MIYQPIENTGKYTTGTVYSEEYVKGLEQKIERLNNIIKDIEDYINFLVIYNQTISGKFSETQWGQDILGLIGSDKE